MSSIYPFWNLIPTKRAELCKGLRAEYEKEKSVSQADFNKAFKNIHDVFESKTSPDNLSSEQQQILNDLNNRACKADKNIIISSEIKRRSITNFTGLLPLGAKAMILSGGAAAVTALFYLRSHRSLAVASACSACACLVIASTCYKLNKTLMGLGKILKELNWHNYHKFSDQVEGAYNELKKTSYLAWLFLYAHDEKLNKADHALRLLDDHLSAVQVINSAASSMKKSFFYRMRQLQNSFDAEEVLQLPRMLEISNLSSTVEDIQKVDLAKMLSFFKRFEKICQKGLYGTAALGLVALAWAYYAYVQRAYLMTIVGIVHFAAASTIFRELYIFQRGSKNIFSVQEQKVIISDQKGSNESEVIIQDKVADAFQEMAARSILFWAMDLEKADRYQIQNTVVIPFDAILKLIPSWKDPVQVK